MQTQGEVVRYLAADFDFAVDGVEVKRREDRS